MKSNLLILCTCTLLFSCKHEKDKPAPQYPNYSQLKVGNYWVYQRFFTDKNGNETPLNQYDSCYVEKDTVIEGRVYAKVIRPYTWGTYTAFLRDSLHYIVNELGQVSFSSEDYLTVFRTWHQTLSPGDTICRQEEKMQDKDKIIVTPAGTFTTSDYAVTFYMYPKYSHDGDRRYQHHRYAVNVGLVYETLETWIGSGTTHTDRKLVRYKVN